MNARRICFVRNGADLERLESLDLEEECEAVPGGCIKIGI